MSEEKKSKYTNPLSALYDAEKVPHVHTLIHRIAMEISDAATLPVRDNKLPEAKTLLNSAAMALEAVCADHLRERDVQPTRGILYRSAASLAWRAGDFRECARLISEGRKNKTPKFVFYELEELEMTLCRDMIGHSTGITSNVDGGLNFCGYSNFDWYDVDMPASIATDAVRDVLNGNSEWVRLPQGGEWLSYESADDVVMDLFKHAKYITYPDGGGRYDYEPVKEAIDEIGVYVIDKMADIVLSDEKYNTVLKAGLISVLGDIQNKEYIGHAKGVMMKIVLNHTDSEVRWHCLENVDCWGEPYPVEEINQALVKEADKENIKLINKLLEEAKSYQEALDKRVNIGKGE